MTYTFSHDDIVAAFKESPYFDTILCTNPRFIVSQGDGDIFLTVEDFYYDVGDPDAERLFYAVVAVKDGHEYLDFEEC